MRRNTEGADPDWIREVLERHEGPLVRYAVRILGDVELARDVVQDTFLALCSARRAAVEGRLAAWLFSVCRNRAIDVKRKEVRMRPFAGGASEHEAASSPSPATVLEKKETDRSVLDAIEALPERQAEVIRLKFQEGLSYREISQVTGLSVSNVGFLIHAGIRGIRQRLAASVATPQGERR